MALADRLTAADDPPVGGILCYLHIAAGQIHLSHISNSAADRTKVGFYLCLASLCDLVRDHAADGGSGGEPRGLNAGGIVETGDILTGSKDEVAAVLVGAKTGEGGDHLAEGNFGHGSGSRFSKIRQTFPGGIYALFVVDILRRGADQEIAVDRRGNQDSLAHFGRGLKDGLIHVPSRALV